MSLKTANFNYFLLLGIHFVSINVVVYLLFEFEVEFGATHRFVHFYHLQNLPVFNFYAVYK